MSAWVAIRPDLETDPEFARLTAKLERLEAELRAEFTGHPLIAQALIKYLTEWRDARRAELTGGQELAR